MRVMHLEFTIWLIMPRPSTKKPFRGGHEIYNFCIFSLVIITISLVCVNHPKDRKIFLTKYINSTLFTLKITSPYAGGLDLYSSLSIYPIDASFQIWFRVRQKFLRRRCNSTSHAINFPYRLIFIYLSLNTGHVMWLNSDQCLSTLFPSK